MDATISVVCYKSKTLSNGEHPLMLRISKDGKKKYQSLGISVNPKFWDFQKNKPKPKCPNLEYRISLEFRKTFSGEIRCPLLCRNHIHCRPFDSTDWSTQLFSFFDGELSEPFARVRHS